MTRAWIFAGLMSASLAAAAADDYKVTQLEQDVRDLQRQVRALTQQIEQQRAPPAVTAGAPVSRPAPQAAAAAPLWVDAARWRRLMPGMSELEVIGILGPPTSMRTEGDQRVLLYAMEIGASGFLGGNVTLRERAVTSVQIPVLR